MSTSAHGLRNGHPRRRATDVVRTDELFHDGGEAGALMRSIEWSRTSLGPVESWSHTLRTMVGVLLRNHSPLLLWWGPEFVQLYNDAYRPVLGVKHPRSMGQPTSECWAEIWHIIGPMIEAPFRGEPATTSDDLFVLINRKGFVEEAHFKVAYSPVPDEAVEGTGIGGVLATVAETTEQVYAERQLRTLRELGARATDAKTVERACELAGATLAENGWDVPFAMFYLFDEPGRRLRLACRVGFEGASSPIVPDEVDLAEAGDLPWQLGDLLAQERPEVYVVGGLSAHSLPRGRWERPAESAIVLPLASPDHEHPYGVLVCGVSPHRTLDERYRTFFELAAAQIVTAIRNARAYQAERERAEALAAVDRAKTAFFSNVSHEFRTPLTLMLGPQEDALRSEAGTLGGDDLRAVHRNTQRLLKLVNTLLDFSRLEAGRVQASYEPVDLAGATRDLASAFRSAVERGGVRFEVDCAFLPAPVYVDRDMWEKIVLNLLSNAFKFTFEGTIAVRLRSAGERALLEVADTGTGIAPDELPRVFERFHRIEGAKARTHEGSGIGLALVHDLVKLHGGEVAVTSEVGAGTTFEVSIPFGAAHLPAERVGAPSALPSTALGAAPFVEEAMRWTSDVPPDAAPPDAAPPRRAPGAAAARVLIADDNADMREYLARLMRLRWNVEVAGDGAQALARALAAPPDLILSDVMMPNLDGFGLLRALREDPRTAEVPFVLLSARAGEEARIEGLQAGADDYVIKPFSARELVARVEAQLALAHARREKREARLEASLQRENLVSLFTQAPMPICILRGEDYVVDLANPAICKVWGRDQAELVGRPLFGALPELREQVFKELLDGVMQTGIAYLGKEVPARLDRRRDDTLETVFFNFVYAPFRNVHGEIEGILVIAFDMTEEVNAREKMGQLRVAAEEANRTKDEFLAMLGHELRNPLSPILTTLRLMRMRGQETRETAMIERQVGHVVRLVDDLLDISRITRGKIELRRERVELATIVVRGVEMASPLLEERRQELDLQVPAEGLAVDGDEDRLAQVVSNLLTNAAKYSERGTKILVVAERAGERVSLSVRDEGVGIGPEMLGRIFGLFVQQPQSLDRSKGGLGLGLAIVRSLVELHGGRVSASSAGPGKGSEFVVELPRAPDVGDALASRREPNELSTPGGFLPARNRILIVDDNVDAAESVADFLEELGFEIRSAYDGPSALTIAQVFKPHVCLLDIGLPVMDGYEVARRLRSSGDLPQDLRIIAVTGYGQEADRRRSAEAGFNAHVVKPLDLDVLTRVVQN